MNDDTVRLGRLNIIKSQDSNNKKDWESMIEDGDFDNTRISIERAPKKLKNVTTKPTKKALFCPKSLFTIK